MVELLPLRFVIFAVLFLFNESIPTACIPKACREYDFSSGKMLDCSYGGLTEIPSNLKTANRYYSLNFSNNAITRVPGNVFKNFSRLVDLKLSSNAIEFVASSAFQYLKTLRNLDLSHNFINYDHLSTNLFKGSESLKYLNISFQQISTLPTSYPNRTLEMVRNLTSLTMDLIPTQRFGAEFKNLTNLQTLILTPGLNPNNVDLTREMFKSLEAIHLNTLVLDNCSVKTADDAFDGLQYLEVVSMNGNHNLGLKPLLSLFKKVKAPIRKLYISYTNTFQEILTFDSTLMQKLQHFPLEVLALCKNYIKDVSWSFHKYFPYLKELYLAENLFVSNFLVDHPSALKMSIDMLQLKNLKLLDFSGFWTRYYLAPTIYSRHILQSETTDAVQHIKTQLTLSSEFSTNITIGLPQNLEYLYLKGTFPGGVSSNNLFVFPNRLKVCDLSENHYGTFPVSDPNKFRGMNNLEVLIMKNNDFAILDAAIYKCCPQLKTLVLAKNKLSVMLSEDNSGKDFVNLDALETIDLSENYIFVLYKDTFKYLRNMRQIILNNNRLTAFALKYLPTLQYLDLSFNFFLDANIDVSTMKEIEAINICSNRIEYLTKEAISKIDSKNVSVDFSKNPFNCTNCLILTTIRWIFDTKRSINLVDESYLACSQNRSLHLKSVNINNLENKCAPPTVWIWVSVAIILAIATLIVTIGIAQRYKWTLKFWLIHLARRKPNDLPDIKYDYDAFICHSSKDIHWMKVFQTTLEEGKEHHFKLCIHYRDFLPGQPIVDCINEAIVNSKYVILLVTSNFIESQWCIYEMYMAKTRVFFQENRSRLVLVLLEKIPDNILQKAPRTLLNLLKDNVYLEWADDPVGQEAFWDRLRERLRSEPPLQIP